VRILLVLAAAEAESGEKSNVVPRAMEARTSVAVCEEEDFPLLLVVEVAVTCDLYADPAFGA
jgi:hypothetical protein